MSCSPKYRKMFMQMANTVSEQSYAVRLKVGCVVVKDDKVVAMSYNGTPKGCDNCCEERKYFDRHGGGWISPDEIEMTYPYVDGDDRYSLKTKDEVIHAEQNAIIQMALSTESIKDCSMFITHAPCLQCAKMVLQAGIKELYFEQEYRDMSGVAFLLKYGVKVTHMPKV